LKQDFLCELNSFYEGLWQDSGAWPDLVSGMRQAVTIEAASEASERSYPRWTLLPRLCCDSIGDTPDGIIELTAAWVLLYAAADLMDAVQDQDITESWWTEFGIGGALGVASGLYFSSSLALTRLEAKMRWAKRQSIIAEIYRGFMLMCSGQLRDIMIESPSLDEYWQIATAKSGAFFGVGCQAAARLASCDQSIQRAFYCLGTEIGLMVQIRDDLEDFKQLKDIDKNAHGYKIQGSLPLVYALEVLPAADSERLNALTREFSIDKAALVELIRTIDNSGAGVYILAELKRHGINALAALENIYLQEPAGNDLKDMIGQLMGAID
jgi:competence protein ComQ